MTYHATELVGGDSIATKSPEHHGDSESSAWCSATSSGSPATGAIDSRHPTDHDKVNTNTSGKLSTTFRLSSTLCLLSVTYKFRCQGRTYPST